MNVPRLFHGLTVYFSLFYLGCELVAYQVVRTRYKGRVLSCFFLCCIACSILLGGARRQRYYYHRSLSTKYDGGGCTSLFFGRLARRFFSFVQKLLQT